LALIGHASPDAIGDKYWTVDATEIIVVYVTAPLSGENNVRLWWLAIKL